MATPERPAVLYVDDEEINVRVFEANFGRRFTVLRAYGGEEALELLGTRSAEVGLLITDQRMPGMTGVELLERVRLAHPDVLRMLVTAYSDLEAATQAVNRGQVMRYIVKPWARAELEAAIEDALRIHALQGQLRSVQARMIQSERLATIGQVSAGIAHELMNPVSYLQQNLGQLRDYLGTVDPYLREALARRPDAAVQEAFADLAAVVADLDHGVRHIGTVATSIKRQVRGDDGERDADLATVVELAVRMARPEVGPRARLRVSGEPLRVAGSPARLTQVVLNLVMNSAQAMDGARAGKIEIAWEADGGQAVLTVRDNGAGIPPELLGRIFDPLFTTKQTGTGLGLGICRDIVRDHGGDIRVDSIPGEGTTATVTLPLR